MGLNGSGVVSVVGRASNDPLVADAELRPAYLEQSTSLPE